MKHLIRMILFMIVVGLVAPSYAQDVPSEATQEATVEAVVESPVVINVNPVDSAPVTPVEPTAQEPWYIKWIAFALLGLGVFTKGFDLANKWLETKKSDVGFVTGAELAGRYTPNILKSGLRGLIKEFIRLGGNLQELLDEATDDVPYVVKVTLPPTSAAAPAGTGGGVTVVTSANPITVSSAPVDFTSTPTRQP